MEDLETQQQNQEDHQNQELQEEEKEEGGGKTEIIEREQRVDQAIDDFEVLFDEGGEQAILRGADCKV